LRCVVWYKFTNVSKVLAASINVSEVLAASMMMEVARTSETMVNFYQTTRRYNPEDSHLRTHRRENLKFYFVDSRFRINLRSNVGFM
jgi:hypothetical protein